MTVAEAVAVIHEGYGDDCPEGGDRYLSAKFVLIEAGLMDESAVSDYERSSRWPRSGKLLVRDPDTGELLMADLYGGGATLSGLSRILTATYLPAIQEALNREAAWLHGDTILHVVRDDNDPKSGRVVR